MRDSNITKNIIDFINSILEKIIANKAKNSVKENKDKIHKSKENYTKDSKIDAKENIDINNLLKAIVEKEAEKIALEENKINKFKNIIFSDVVEILLNDAIFKIEEQKNLLLKLRDNWNIFEENISYPWLLDKNIVVFAGKFSAGKSSVINILLGDDLLPINVTPTTAVPSYITYDKDSKNKFYIAEHTGEIKSLDISVLKYFAHHNMQNIPIPLPYIMKFFLIPTNNKYLANTVIVDTPGYDPGQQTRWDKQRSIESMEKADAIFWIIDIADGGLTKDSVEMLKIYSKNKKLFVVINKSDKKPPKAVKKVVNQVRDDLKNYKINYEKAFPFSSKKPEKYINNLRNVFSKFNKISKKQHSIFRISKEIVNDAIDRIINSQKELKSSLKNYNNKNIKDEFRKVIQDKIDKITKNNLKVDHPFFGDPHYEIGIQQWKKVKISLLETIDKNLENFANNLRKKEKVNYKLDELDKLDKLLNKSRKILRELEKLEKTMF